MQKLTQVKYIIVHCSATAEGKDFHAADIDRWHKAEGWEKIGYHYVVCLDGSIEVGRKETEVGAHCYGYNSRSLGVCYVGGVASDGRTPKDTRTAAQRASLLSLLKALRKKYPSSRILSHHDLNQGKACPSFDARNEYKDI